MKTTIIMLISDEEKDAKVYAKAGEENATINIFAKTIEEAKSMLPEGEKLLQEAQANATETDEEEAGELEYTYTAPMTVKAAEEAIESYYSDKEGKRFINTVAKAFNFAQKTDKTGFFNLWQYRYFALLAYAKDPYEAIIKAYALGYHKGYKKGHREAKKGD